MSVLRVTLAGCGRVGRDFARVVALTDEIAIVAACSRNPEHVGQRLDSLAGVDIDLPVVCATLEEALEQPSDVLLIATASHLDDVAESIRAGIAAQRNVLTTSEEAAYPWVYDRPAAEDIDRAARAAGVTVLGTGVNPGFTYDAIVLTMTGASWDVPRIDVERIVDISGYSAAIQRRSGIGFSKEEFERRCATGEITGHIGFPQSMSVVAAALGREIDRIDRSIEPLLAKQQLEVAGLVVEPGETAGFIQHYVGIVAGEPWFVSHLVAHIDMDDAGLSTRDTIEIGGSVPVRMVVEPAFNSQTTVAAVLANSIERVAAAPPGWLTVGDLPPAVASGERRPAPETQR